MIESEYAYDSREVDAFAHRHLADRLGLVRTVRVELELARVAAFLVEAGARRDHVVDTEVLADRLTVSIGDDEMITVLRPARLCSSMSSSASA